VDPRSSLDVLVKRKILALPGIELRSNIKCNENLVKDSINKR
jgi:hypothetical protein